MNDKCVRNYSGEKRIFYGGSSTGFGSGISGFVLSDELDISGIQPLSAGAGFGSVGFAGIGFPGK